MNAQKKPILMLVGGLLYGVVLGVLAFFCVGAGHGTSIPALLSSAPLGVFGVLPAYFGAPLLWAGLGFLFGKDPNGRSFFWGLILHYVVGSIFVVTLVGNQAEYIVRSFQQATFTFLSWLVMYVGGQVFVWQQRLKKE